MGFNSGFKGLINEFVKSRCPKKFLQRINFSSRQFTYLLNGAYHNLLRNIWHVHAMKTSGGMKVYISTHY